MLCDCRRVFSAGNLLKLAILIVVALALVNFLPQTGYLPPNPFHKGVDNSPAGYGAASPNTAIGVPDASSGATSYGYPDPAFVPPADAFDPEGPAKTPVDMPEEEPTESWTEVSDSGFGDDDGYAHRPWNTTDLHTEDDAQPDHKAFTSSCPSFAKHAEQRHQPLSTGKAQLAFQRPDEGCRTFTSNGTNDLISRYRGLIKDPDLYRLFENCFPNTLDTAIRWKGRGKENGEELAFLITGDIDALRLRDSAQQLSSYKSLLNVSESEHSLASLFRGVINLQTRYITKNPYCNSFQPPKESGISPSVNDAAVSDVVEPKYDKAIVFECKYELDSLAAFLQISTDYYSKTNDIDFFRDGDWASAVNVIIDTVETMMVPTYGSDGAWKVSPYKFFRTTHSSRETLIFDGHGSPVASGIGLIRSEFRPSDDATMYQYLIPANMMFTRYLESTSKIMSRISGRSGLAKNMQDLAAGLRSAISKHGIVHDPKYGDIYAYEIDGYGGVNVMDDANIPSLLSAPVFGYLDASDPIYQNTRRKILSSDNPWFMRGPVISAVGGPRDGPGQAWPISSIVRILTSDDSDEIYTALKEIVTSTGGLGLIHESVSAFDQTSYTRPWFSWANGLLGEAIIDLQKRKPEILQMSFQ